MSGEEHEAVLPDLHLVAVLELDPVDPVAVHVGAVEAAHVADRERLAAAVELRVAAGDRDVVEEDLAVGVATGLDDVRVEELMVEEKGDVKVRKEK